MEEMEEGAEKLPENKVEKKSNKRLTKTQRKFSMTLQKAAKQRRKEIESISRLDPLLKAFFTKTYKGD